MLFFLLPSTENEQCLSVAHMRGQALLSEHPGTTDGSAGNAAGEQNHLPQVGCVLNAQDAQDVQNAQDMQTAQGVQDAQGVQNTQDAQNA